MNSGSDHLSNGCWVQGEALTVGLLNCLIVEIHWNVWQW